MMLSISLNPLTPIENGLTWVIKWLHDTGHLTYGWAIVVLTILVRLALVPLAVKQLRSMRHMQEAGPQIKALQQKYAGDKPRQQQELMAFYKEHEINPFASCLPLVFQAPIFLGLFYSLRNFSEHVSKGADLGFLGIVPDISAGVKSIGWGAVVLLFVYGLSQLLSFEVSATPATPKFQRWLMRFAPIVITLLVLVYPNITAGLLIYWVTTNLWTCGQQLVLKKKIGPAMVLANGAGTPTPPSRTIAGEAPKGWRARLEAMQAAAQPSTNDVDTTDVPAKAHESSARPSSGGGSDNETKRRPRPKGGASASAGSPPPRRRPPKKGSTQ